jgi:predicted helicase
MEDRQMNIPKIKAQLKGILEKSRSWDDVYSQFISLQKSGTENKIIGDLFEMFCEAYFSVEPSIKNDYRNVWLRDKIPAKVFKKLGLCAKGDRGVDLLLEDTEGRFTAVQCKFHCRENSLLDYGTQDKLSHLMAEGRKAEYRTVFTNVYAVDDYVKSDCLTVTYSELNLIQHETLIQMIQFLSGDALTPFYRSPRDHQKEAVEKVIDGFKSEDRGQFISACGSGKTLTAFWIKEAMKDVKSVLALFPSLALLKQTRFEWQAESKNPTPYICICSDVTVANGDDNDTLSISLSSIPHVTTDVNEIVAFLKRYKNQKFIVYSTYQSSGMIVDALKSKGMKRFKFDLSIADEAHKTAGKPKSINGVEEKTYFGYIHSDKCIRVKKRLYMTATPRVIGNGLREVAKEKEIGEPLEDYVYCMNDERIYGKKFYELYFAEAIERKILCDYEIVIIGVNSEVVHKAIIDRQLVSEYKANGGEMPNAEELAQNFVIKAVNKQYGIKHIISFHSRVKAAQELANRQKHVTGEDIWASSIDGSMNTDMREGIMKQFKSSDIGVLSNAQCLTEGVDIPAVDGVVFFDPKNSLIDIVQAVGRAMRVKEGKERGYVILPVWFTPNSNIEEAVDKSIFQSVVKVINSLKAYDTRLQAEIRELHLDDGRKKQRGNEKYRIHMSSLTDSIDLPDLPLDEFKKKIEGTIITHILKSVNRGNWTRESLIEKIIELAKELGRTPKETEFCSYINLRIGFTCYGFKNYYDLVRQCGLRVTINYSGFTREDLIKIGKSLYIKLKRAPKEDEIFSFICQKRLGWVNYGFNSYGGYLESCGIVTDKLHDYVIWLNIYKPNIICLEVEFRGMKVKHWHQCKKCGYKWKALPSKIKNRDGCPGCSGNIHDTDFHSKVMKNLCKKKNIRMLDGYAGANIKVKFKCLKCGREWKTTASSIKCGTGCSSCSHKEADIKKRAERFSHLSDKEIQCGVSKFGYHKYSKLVGTTYIPLVKEMKRRGLR